MKDEQLRGRLERRRRGFAQKVIHIQLERRHYWERGRPRPPAYLRLLLKMADKPCSRFALSAGEGARTPSNGGSLSSSDDLLGKARPRQTSTG